jgi:hypothetical protein
VRDSGETNKIAFYSSLATLRDNADRRQEGGIVLAVSRNYVRSLAVLLGRFSSIVSNKRSNKKLYFPVLHDVFGRFKDQQTLGKGGFCQSPAAVWGATLRVVPSQQCPVFLVTAGEEKAVIVKKGCESRRSCHLARHGSSAFSIGTRHWVTLSGSGTTRLKAFSRVPRRELNFFGLSAQTSAKYLAGVLLTQFAT